VSRITRLYGIENNRKIEFQEMKVLNSGGAVDKKYLRKMEYDIFSGVQVITSYYKRKILETCFELSKN
jgi:hypothetical protein